MPSDQDLHCIVAVKIDPDYTAEIIRIVDGCKGWIEKSVPRVCPKAVQVLQGLVFM